MKRQINKKVRQVEKLYQLREAKITALKEKIKHEAGQQRDHEKMIENSRNTREAKQMTKMERAYLDMIKVENDKKRFRE